MKTFLLSISVCLLLTLIISCKKNITEVPTQKEISIGAVANELGFKIRDRLNVRQRVVNHYGTVNNWRNYIINFKQMLEKVRGSNGSSTMTSGYQLTIIDETGFAYNFSQQINPYTSIMDFLDAQGFQSPQCERAGASPTCIGYLISGAVDSYDQSYLNDCELEAGFLLPCVSYCLSDCVIRLDESFYYNLSGNGNCEQWDEDYAFTAGCKANDNLSMKADPFIELCRKASIRQEFPDELLQSTLQTIKNGSTAKHKKAWKLLNDKRFSK